MRTKIILIVDDNIDARIIFGAILNFDGYHVVEAHNGQAAIDAAQLHRPDLILMDMMMPVLDGVAATRQLRAHAETQSIPVIAVTGNIFSKSEGESLISLFDGHLTKPVSPTRVLAEVQRVIGAPHMNET